MRIILDIRTTFNSGIYRYGVSIIPNLINLSRRNKDKVIIIYEKDNDLINKVNKKFSTKFIKIPLTHRFTHHDNLLHEIIFNEKIDLYYSTHYFCDPYIQIPFIFTIHDLTRIHFPKTLYTQESFKNIFGQHEYKLLLNELSKLKKIYPNCNIKGNKIYKYFYLNTKRLIEKSFKVTTVSSFSKNDIIKTFVTPEEKVKIIPGSVDKTIFHSKIINNSGEKIPENYFLYVGNNHPHKNLMFIIKAFSILKNKTPNSAKLVLVISNKKDYFFLLENIKNNFYFKDIILFFNISDQLLSILYSNASAVIIASINEGFCLPALEAALCNAPIISSDLPVIHEIIKNYPSYFDSGDINNLISLMEQAYNRNLPKGDIRQIDYFSWQESAIALYKTFLG